MHLSPRGIEEAFSDHEAPDGDAGQLRILPRALFPSSKFWESRRPRSAYAVSYKSFPTVEEKIVRMVEDHAWLPFFHDCLKRRIRPDSRYRMTLRDWQAYPFPRAEIIFQASPMDGSDSMVPYPVGMHWRYWAQKQDCNRRFARNRHCLLKLNPDTDKRRHHLPVNRPAILAMLGDRFE